MKSFLVLVLCLVQNAIAAEKAQVFTELLPVYGVVKPAAISTLLAINHGIIVDLHKGIGDVVSSDSHILEVMEKETVRTYRSGLNGQVAKLHVTKGAAVTPGMPMVTILDPKSKKFEVSLSAQEAGGISVGAVVLNRADGTRFGVIEKVSPIIDPDNGGVTSYVRPDLPPRNLIGDVIALNIVVRQIEDCRVVDLSEMQRKDSDEVIAAISGKQVCLKRVPAAAK